MIPGPKRKWAMVKFSLVRRHATTTELFKHLQVAIPLMRNQDTDCDDGWGDIEDGPAAASDELVRTVLISESAGLAWPATGSMVLPEQKLSNCPMPAPKWHSQPPFGHAVNKIQTKSVFQHTPLSSETWNSYTWSSLRDPEQLNTYCIWQLPVRIHRSYTT